ncbi:MAG: hypothetical protein WCP07_03125 [bacterium]|jgi:hypothetical protein
MVGDHSPTIYRSLVSSLIYALRFRRAFKASLTIVAERMPAKAFASGSGTTVTEPG